MNRQYLSQSNPQILIKNKADFIAQQEKMGVPGFSRQTLQPIDAQKIQEAITMDLQNVQADPAMLMAAQKIKDAEAKKSRNKKLLIGGGVILAATALFFGMRKKKTTKKPTKRK